MSVEKKNELPVFERLTKIVEHGMYTCREVKNKLYERGYLSQEINEAIERAIDFNYLNDDEYARVYVEKYGAARGSIRIKVELKRKGVSEDIIENALTEKPADVDGAFAYAKNFMAKYDISDEKTYAKLMRALYYRGYGWDASVKAIEMAKKDGD